MDGRILDALSGARHYAVPEGTGETQPGGRPRARAAIRGVLLFAVVAAGYAIGSELSRNWFSAPDQGASFFPPAGLTVAALLLVARRRWAIVLGAAAAAEVALDTWHGTGAPAAVGYALANTMEPLVGALLVLSAVAVVDLRRTRDLTAFLAYGVIVAPVVGATIAATTFVYVDDHAGWARFAFEWWCGDGLGVLVVGAAILSLRPWPAPTRRHLLEGAIVGSSAVAATWLLFQFGWFAFVYLPIALLVILAFRGGTPVVALTAAAAAFVAAGSTAEADDFWKSIDVSPADRILYLQLALGVIVAALLMLAAEIAGREQIAMDLARAESERTVALERAELTESEQRARIHAESIGRSAALLAQSASAADVAEATVTVMASWGARQCTFYLVEGDQLVLLAGRGITGSDWTAYGTLPVVLSCPTAETAFTGMPVVIQHGEEYDRRYPSFAAYRRRQEWETIAAFPVVVADAVRAVLSTRFEDAGWVTDDRYDLLFTLTDQAAVALERASLLRLERDARARAEVLQSHATRLAAAATVRDVARTTLAGLGEEGLAAGIIHRVAGDHLEVVEAVGQAGERVEPSAHLPIGASTPASAAVRTGSVVVVSSAAELKDRFPEAADAEGAPFESLVSVPLFAARGRTLGVLTFTSLEPGGLDDGRKQLVMGLAEQCGLALERAELQADADAAAEDEALLAHLGEVLERATGMADRAAEVARALTRDRAALAAIHLVHGAGPPRPLAESRGEPSAPDADEELLVALAAAAASADAATTGEAGTLDLCAVPLRARDRMLGVLTVGATRGGNVTPLLVRRIATRVALALDNAMLYEQERDVSHSLQLGLLGRDLTSGPRTAIATAYRPGTATLEVGGDWHDSFTLPDGKLALLVGDVVGHGLDAAVAMGQLRGAVRALAPLGPPSELLKGLDIFVEQLPAAAMSTLAYAELDLEGGRITYACAGHPPPLLVPIAGEPRLLWGGRSTPLGSSYIGERYEAVDELRPGDTIVLYTDGLVERRSEGISPGLELMLTVAAEAPSREPSALVATILEALLGDGLQEDDVCILAVARAAPELRFVHSFRASPRAIAGLRHAFTDWLEDVDLEPMKRRDAVLAVSEAAANAAEHAYGFDGLGIVDVEAWVLDGQLDVLVRDQGSWREPQTQTERGRGRTIMAALMGDVRVDYRRGGTVVWMRLPLRAEVPA